MEKLLHLLEEGVSAAHTIDFVKRSLLEKGFEELSLGEEWNLEENGKYYVNLYGTNMVAFRIGKKIGKQPAFRVAMAHSDYPHFQIKPEPMLKGKKVSKLNVDLYGGMYQKSWLDRPLGIAGRVVIRGENAFSPITKLYKSEKALCIIPSLAIHMERELNKKGALDVAKELVPLAALSEEVNVLTQIAENLQVKEEDILDYELLLYNMEKPVTVGLDEAMLSSPRLDNLTSVGAILSGLEACEEVEENVIDVMAVFDHEEVGSRTKQGADSELLSMLLEKIGKTINGTTFALSEVVSNSFLLSVDVAHAHHPNYEEKSDLRDNAYMKNGFCIKRSIGQKYGTTAESSSVLKALCEQYYIPYTVSVNKTGIAGGSTLGPIVTSHLPFPCADIGMPILAMHSAQELCAVSDYKALQQMVLHFFQEK